ncbi:MAG: DUF4012 domain-containing protein [Acidimicrobiales bacterium]
MSGDARLAEPARPTVRRRRRSRYRRARRWLRKRLRWPVVLALACLFALGAVVIGAAAWRDVRPVRAELKAARGVLQRAVDDPAALRTSERRAGTLAEIQGAMRTIATARRRVERSPAVGLARLVPLVSRQRAGLLSILRDAEEGAGAGLHLLTQVQDLDQGTLIRQGSIPFDGLQELSTELGGAGRRIQKLVKPSSGLWGDLRDARREFNRVAQPMAERLVQGGDALAATRTFIGADGDRRHLVAMLNNAEMRDQGMVLSYAIAHFSGGQLTFEKTGSVDELPLDRHAPTPVPPGTQQVFGFINPTLLWQSVNATADFAWSGRAMVEMYQQASGQPVDGVIAIDVPGLAALLRVVGPVSIDGIAEPITAENASRILLHDLYEGLAPTSPQGERRERLADVTQTVIQRLTASSQDAVALGRELGEVAAGGHFRLWSPRPDEEGVFERTGLGGGPAVEDADRTFHVAVENRTATKLDYYVKPSVEQVITLTPEAEAVVRTKVVIENQAPVGAPASYQLGPDEFTSVPGEYTAWVLLWGPAGAAQPNSVPESGLTLSQEVQTVHAGDRTEVTFETRIPDAVRNGRMDLRLVPQPRLENMDLSVRLEPGVWRATGPTTWRGPWDRARRFSWPVQK